MESKIDVETARMRQSDSLPQPAGQNLWRVHAMTARASTEPLEVVCCGSSTTSGMSATAPSRRWVNLCAEALQRSIHPTLPTHPTLVLDDADQRNTDAPGLRIINAGVPGTTSQNYLTPASVSAISRIAPRLVIHMVGSNDAWAGVHPDRYRAQLHAQFSRLQDATSVDCIHLLVHSYARYDEFTPVAPWAAYGEVLSAIAAEREDTAAVDISGIYAAVGVPGNDPRHFMTDDRVHQTDAGHAFMAKVMARVLEPAQGATGY
ncbi:lysophospholipase L1-like esterase [Microbacterium endophyticum]|uniref:Lysophospholipase L1-like esterase n=2 Tax=Microbacterium endophyticum TaxID=1526412 RepID=A0A7W4YMM0_9MICO|nr:SGNH/GDSL hydrolase family protein [Microbacterium endophyticum]MBB2976615.1 lysophospholipase L1-like esterase [Microbacterium endophyticum]